MRVLLITPPMSQMNSPYPATAYLKGFLQSQGHAVEQMDLGLELFLRLFSRRGLLEIREVVGKIDKINRSEGVKFFLEAFDDYLKCIEPVIDFLQGKNSSLALRLAERKLLPEGPRFLPLREHAENILLQFGSMGLQDKAKFMASLFLDDLSDVLRDGVDSDFEFSRYAEKLADSQNSFSPLHAKLKAKPNLIDRCCEELFGEAIQKLNPEVVGFTVPFPGNLYLGLRMGAWLKKHAPQIPRVMGGGFVSTELRELSDPRFFEFVDYLLFDDGEATLQELLQQLQKKSSDKNLLRGKALKNGKVQDFRMQDKSNVAFKEHPGPDFSGLPLDKYISMLEMPNPVHRMWSDFRWNKMILAHGCYWKKCTFCDVNLDYIGRFEPQQATKIVDQMQAIMLQTGSSGFHFVDEAAPPALLKAISLEILKRGMVVTWWGNLRFDKQFTPELCELMSDAGCVAVTGGLEVASARVLKLINKGLTLEQVAAVTKNFSQAGILVHAYLMYGFPTQTEQETIDSLEVVRKLFATGSLQSAHWHRFIATKHSPVGRDPQKFFLRLKPELEPEEGVFARYQIDHEEFHPVDHDRLGLGLRKALYNYMHGVGLDEDVGFWFEDLKR